MKQLKLTLCAAGASLALAATAHADPLPAPSFTPPLAADPSPPTLDAGPLGKLSFGGAITGLGMAQSNAVPGDHEWQADFSNAQAWVEKTDGMIQYFAEVGAYSFPSVGYPYIPAKTTVDGSFGVLPVGYLKIVPNSSFSIEAGKLPTLIGAEYGFTFQNMNIDRGLLWFQEPIVSRGIQANFSKGPVSLSVSVNDGYYTSRYNSFSGLLTFTMSPNDTLAVSGGGPLGRQPSTTFAGASSDIIDLMYSHTAGPWTFSPYIQWQHVQGDPVNGIPNGGTTWGGALLAKYTINKTWSMAGRVEYISESGTVGSAGTDLLGYGRGSNAWSLTLTPTYQKGIYFIRGEASYVKVDNLTGFGFGPLANKDNQFRAAIETGVLF